MLATLVALCLAAPAEDKELPEAAKKELKQLEGKWKAVRLVVNDKDEEVTRDGADVFLTFKGRKVLLGDEEVFEIPALDPSTDPKCLDLKAVADVPGVVGKGTLYEAVYKIDGDTLVMALHLVEGKGRPVKFESPKDSGVAVVTLKREKN
jgi:uncharacterized protein (TIGR03067 family)